MNRQNIQDAKLYRFAGIRTTSLAKKKPAFIAAAISAKNPALACADPMAKAY